MPNCRTPTVAFGITTHLTACGSYVPSSSFSLIFAQCSRRYGINCSTVNPSTPAAPLFLFTCSYALSLFSRATTASINCSVSGLTVSLLAALLDAPASYPRDFRPLLFERVSDISAILSSSPPVAKLKRQSFSTCLGLRLGRGVYYALC